MMAELRATCVAKSLTGAHLSHDHAGPATDAVLQSHIICPSSDRNLGSLAED